MALAQNQTPHEGLGFQQSEKVRAFLLSANDKGRRGREKHRATKTRYNQYDDVIRSASEKYNVPFSLVKAVVAVESAFEKDALSRAGAQGLMQLMPQTAAELGVADPFDAQQNIDGGTRYLAGLLRMFSSEDLAVAAYNAGPGRVRRAGRIPRIQETQAYVIKVAKLRTLYESIYSSGIQGSSSPEKIDDAAKRTSISVSPRTRESK
ncbi:MAG: lytic transglycosylase domain-containing protein [Deltaproteobacteria bacterium]|nr:lytic transglycosylase domain-containing protein [Deltaproteobacteria bacterium]